MTNTLTRKVYDKFILPVEKTATTSLDYYKGIMIVCTGYRVYQCNPTTNKVLSFTDLDTKNPVIDIDVDSYGTFYAICQDEQKIKRFDTFTGQVIDIINIDNFSPGQISSFRYFSSFTKSPDAFYFIDGFFNSTLKTNRLIRFDLTTQISTIVNEIEAANVNDLEYDDIGLLRLTDVKGVIERYNIIFQSIDFGKKIDEIPVGEPVNLLEGQINPTPNPIETFEISPPDITYFIEQPFAFLTLEPNSDYLPCTNPQEWQLVLNPNIACEELSINFINLFEYNQATLNFVDSIEINDQGLVVTLNSLYDYAYAGINLIGPSGKIFGSTTLSGNIVSFNLENPYGDDLENDIILLLNTLYSLEIIVKRINEPITNYYSFNTNFVATTFPLIISSFDTQGPTLVSKVVSEDNIKLFFSENIDNTSLNNLVVTEIDPDTLISNLFTGSFQVINNEVIFTPDLPFNNNYQYIVDINNVKDLSGNEFNRQGFAFKYNAQIIGFNQLISIIPNDFQLILDAMESQQQKQYEAWQTLEFYKSEKKLLLRDKKIIETIIELEEQRTDLLLNYDTVSFPYNYQLQHIDRVLLEYNTLIGENTLDDINLQITNLDLQINILKKYITDLEEILRYAELRCLEQDVYIQEFGEEVETQSATSGQALVDINTFTYTLGGNFLAVYVNDIRQVRDIDYVELSPTQIEFLSPLNLSDEIKLINFKTTAPTPNVIIPNDQGDVLVIDSVPNYIDAPNKSEYQFADINQLTFILKNINYTVGSDTLFVYVNKVLQQIGADYVETFSDEIQFLNTPAAGSLIEFKQGIRLGNNVQTEFNFNAFKVYDSFNREIPLEDLQPFYLEIENEDIAEIVIDSGIYYLFGVDTGQTNLFVNIGGNRFTVPIEVFDSYTPPLPIVPYHCPQFLPPLDDIYQLVLVDLTTPCVEETLYKEKQPESHLALYPITNCETGTIQVNPGTFALMLEGTVNFPDFWENSLLIEDAQENQPYIVYDTEFELILEPESFIEMPIVLEDSLETDIYEPLAGYLRLSPTAFDQDLIIQESLQFDPSLELDNPLVLEQGIQNPSPGGPLEIEFMCFDTPADDEENTVLIQGNTGLQYPLKITWDGDFCYVLYDGECAASLIDLKSILRKVFISTPDPELYGIGLHTTTIFGQARDIEGQEFALSKISSKSVSFIDTFNQFLTSKNTESLNDKIFVSTTGSYYSPTTIEQDLGIIFNYNYQSGIRLNPGEHVTINFNRFTQLEGSTFVAKTPNPLQYISIETSEDGINYTSQDLSVINKTNLNVYELNQFLYGIQSNKTTTYIRFIALDDNTDYVDIALVNLFYDQDKFNRTEALSTIESSVNSSLLVINQGQTSNIQFTYSPDPINFLSQTFTAPINPLVSNPVTNTLESSSLSVSGIPASNIIPAVFDKESASPAINPISPITDVRGNNELIYKSGLLYSFKNYILNSDWKWALLNWNINGLPFIQFKPTPSEKQLILSRNITNQTIKSGIFSQPIQCLPFTTYYVSYSGLCNTLDNVSYIILEYYDINNNFLTYSTPIYLSDVDEIISIPKITPEFATSLKVFIGFNSRNSDNLTSLNDTIKLDWVSLTSETQTSFTPYNDNLDVIKIAIDI